MNEDASERAKTYVTNVENALLKVRWTSLPATITIDNAISILDSVRRYVSDAKYYLDEHKPITALASISYAEGLLDAIKFLRIADFSWKAGAPQFHESRSPSTGSVGRNI
jgi:FAD synthetase